MLVCLVQSSLHEILGAVGKENHKRCIIIDPAHPKPIGFQFIQSNTVVLKGIVDVVIHIAEQFGGKDSFGSHMIQLLLYTLILVGHAGGTINHVFQALMDKNYLEKLVDAVNVPYLTSYFKEVLPVRLRTGRESITALLNRLYFFNEPELRNLFGQLTPTVALKELVQQEYILILDLKEGAMGRQQTALIAGIFVLLVCDAIMNRGQGQDTRRPFHLFLDESPLYITSNLMDVLASGRVFGARTIMSAQSLSQFDTEMRESILSSLPTKLCYRVDSNDAHRMRYELGIQDPGLLVHLPNHHACCRVGKKAFYMKGLEPLELATDEEVEEVRQRSAETFGGKPVELTEEYYNHILHGDKNQRSHREPSLRIPHSWRMKGES